MVTVFRDSAGTQSISIDAILSAQRIIFIYDDINDKMAANVTKQLLFFSIFTPEKPVKMLITSNGGSINAGLVIFDCMRSCNLHIETYCIGRAFSMATLLCAAVLCFCTNHFFTMKLTLVFLLSRKSLTIYLKLSTNLTTFYLNLLNNL